jgi:hypothetical protein
MDNQNLFYYAFDGDSIGRRHAAALLSDNVEDIHNISAQITDANEMVRDFVESNGGTMISFGGDEGVFSAPPEFVDLLEQLRKDYEYIIGATLSIGYGTKPSEAGKALLEAKETGKDKIVQYSESSEKYAQDVQQDRNSEHLEDEQNQPDDEERKKIKSVLSSEEDLYDPNSIHEDVGAEGEPQDEETDEGVGHDQVLPEGADAAINEPTLCEPPKEDNNMGYDSGYKNDEPEPREDSYRANDLTPPTIRKPNLTPKPPVMQAVSGDVPESGRLMNEELPDPKDVEAVNKKPDPTEYHGQAEGDAAPESMVQPMEQKPGDLKYYSGKQGKPDACMPEENATSDEAMETEAENMGVKHCESCTCDQHERPMDEVLDQHIDNAKDFSDSLEDDNGDQEAEEILDQHLDNATEMNQEMDQNGVSRPMDYDEKQGDMGLSEEEADQDEPNLDEVLQGGLDQHADNIQREKVIQLVGQALDGFKSQKAILDKAKDQAPELYSSCISMLRAMIELCSLAGLDNSGEAEQEVNEIEGQSESPEEMPGTEEMPEQEEMPEEASQKAPQK